MTKEQILAERDKLAVELFKQTYDRCRFCEGFDAAVKIFLGREKVLRDTLKYCSIDPSFLHPVNNAQHIAASNILTQVPEWE